MDMRLNQASKIKIPQEKIDGKLYEWLTELQEKANDIKRSDTCFWLKV